MQALTDGLAVRAGGRCGRRGRRRAGTVLLALAGLLLGGCLSTSLIDQWHDPAFSGPPLHRVLIVGVQRDPGRRRVWEDGMVAALDRQGVAATASYGLFPDKAPTPEQLAAAAAHDGFDGALATHFVGASQRTYWMPGYAGIGYGWRWRYYGYWGAVYAPGYLETEQRADYQTDVFTIDANGGRLIWTGITRSVDLSALQGTTDEIGRVLVPELQREGVLAGHHG